MRFIYVDDEKSALTNLDFYLKNRPLVKSVKYFTLASDALAYAERTPFDIAFLDIEMPQISGFDLAIKLKELQPNIEIIYVTAFNQYHQEAYETGGRAYLLKPFDSDDIDKVFSFLEKLSPVAAVPAPAPTQPTNEKPRIFIQTFGNFDLWVDGSPVIFKNAKAKELLAVLVDHRGSIMRNIDVFNYLWPSKLYSKSTATYVRKVVQALKKRLLEIGCEDIVTFSRNACYINPTALVCDYYVTTSGDASYLPSYNGYYMAQYPWAEESIYIIEQNIKALSKEMVQPIEKT